MLGPGLRGVPGSTEVVDGSALLREGPRGGPSAEGPLIKRTGRAGYLFVGSGQWTKNRALAGPGPRGWGSEGATRVRVNRGDDGVFVLLSATTAAARTTGAYTSLPDLRGGP